MEVEVLQKYYVEETARGAHKKRGEPVKWQVKAKEKRCKPPKWRERIAGLGFFLFQRIQLPEETVGCRRGKRKKRR